MTHIVSWKCRFRIRTYIFEIPTSKPIFGQIWVKVKVLRFSWKLARMASSQCWFLFQHLGQKSQSLPEHWYTCYLVVADSFSNISFFNLERKTESCSVWLKIGTQSVSTMLILIAPLLFSVSNPKSFFRQVWTEKFKVVHFD